MMITLNLHGTTFTFTEPKALWSSFQMVLNFSETENKNFQLKIFTTKLLNCFDIQALCSKASSGIPTFPLNESMCFLNWEIASRGFLAAKEILHIYFGMKMEICTGDIIANSYHMTGRASSASNGNRNNENNLVADESCHSFDLEKVGIEQSQLHDVRVCLLVISEVHNYMF